MTHQDSSWEEQMLADRAEARKRQVLDHKLASLEDRLARVEDLLEKQTAALAEALATIRAQVV